MVFCLSLKLHALSDVPQILILNFQYSQYRISCLFWKVKHKHKTYSLTKNLKLLHGVNSACQPSPFYERAGLERHLFLLFLGCSSRLAKFQFLKPAFRAWLKDRFCFPTWPLDSLAVNLRGINFLKNPYIFS